MDFGSKQTLVGALFEQVGHRILGGELSRDAYGDICLWRTDTMVEVKASGSQSSYGFRLDIRQIENYQQSGFSAWYMFFAYENPRLRNGKGKRSTKLSKHLTPVSISRYLINNVSWCVLVDLSIVSRWNETRPHSMKSIMGHQGTPTVDVKCSNVHELANGGLASGLRNLGLDSAKFGSLTGVVETTLKADLLGEHVVKFPMTAILPTVEISSLQRMLKRRGFDLKRGSVV